MPDRRLGEGAGVGRARSSPTIRPVLVAELFPQGHDSGHQEVDVDRDSAAYDEMIKLSGQRFTPTLVADGRVLADFGTDELEIFLKQHSIQP